MLKESNIFESFYLEVKKEVDQYSKTIFERVDNYDAFHNIERNLCN